MLVPCPDCAAALAPGAVSCPACGLPLAGPTAARLWQVDQSIAGLRAERVDLLAALRSAAEPAEPTSGRVRWSPGRLLLAAGVVLLLVAAVVFVSIAWTRIGVGGQCALLLATTGGAVAVSRTLARRALRASSEAVAVLALGLAALDLDAAHRLGLAGLDAIEADTYAVVALALLVTFAAGAARLVGVVLAYPLGAVLAAGLVPLAAIDASDGGLTGTAAASAVAVLAGVAAAVVTATARRTVLGAVLLVTAAWVVVGALAGAADAYAHPVDDTGGTAVLSLIAIAAAMLLLARTGRLPRTVRRAARLAVAAVVVGGVVAVTHHAGPLALIGVSLAAAAVVVLRRGRGLQARGAYVLAWAAGLAAELEPATRSPGQRALWLTALTLAAAVVATSTTGGNRRLATGLAGLTGVVAAVAAVGHAPLVVQVTSLLLVTVALTLAAGWRHGQPEESALALSAVVAGFAAATFDGGDPDRTVPVAVVLATCGLLALGYASLPRRGYTSIAGVLLCSGATWTLSADASVTTIEVYTLPLAALALVVGGIRLRRYPTAPSWTTVGPGLSAALVPSALATFSDDGLTRPLVVLLVAVLTTIGGTALRWQAPVVTGVVAAVLVAVAQLGPYVLLAPRSLSLAVGGAVLLALGARYEQRRRDARDAAHWVGGLR